LGIFSLGVVAPVLFLVISSSMRSKPTSCIAPAFFAYGIPVYVHFYVSFWFILSNLRPPVVVVAFGYPLPFCGFLLFPGASGEFFGMTSCINLANVPAVPRSPPRC
jgi:hypothetical protein